MAVQNGPDALRAVFILLPLNIVIIHQKNLGNTNIGPRQRTAEWYSAKESAIISDPLARLCAVASQTPVCAAKYSCLTRPIKMLSLPYRLRRSGVDFYHALFVPPPVSFTPLVMTVHGVEIYKHPEFFRPRALRALKTLFKRGGDIGKAGDLRFRTRSRRNSGKVRCTTRKIFSRLSRGESYLEALHRWRCDKRGCRKIRHS